jgi:hypothetical protein
MARISKSEGVRVTVHKGSKHLGGKFDRFDSISEVKEYVKRTFKKSGIVDVMVSQDGGYYNSFRTNTN